MGRSTVRLTAVAIIISATSTLGSAAEAQPPRPLGATSLAAMAMPVDQIDPRPERIPAATASPVASPTTSLPTVVGRPAATLQPIAAPVIDAQALVLVNLDTGRFLWQTNGRASRAPASLTKIFTAMVAVDLMGLDTLVTVPDSIRQLPADSTFMGLTPGERVTVRELLYGVFLNSGNDAAETLASATTSRSTFIADMNAKAARLGLRATHFLNPTGLDGAGHYSSAADLAVGGVYLESHYPALVGIAATPAITLPATALHKTYALVNLDKLLHTYPGTYGLKTGWTEQALGCLITTSSRGGHRLLAVLLGAPNGTAYAQMPKVLDYGFELLGVLPRPVAP